MKSFDENRQRSTQPKRPQALASDVNDVIRTRRAPSAPVVFSSNCGIHTYWCLETLRLDSQGPLNPGLREDRITDVQALPRIHWLKSLSRKQVDHGHRCTIETFKESNAGALRGHRFHISGEIVPLAIQIRIRSVREQKCRNDVDQKKLQQEQI